MSRHTIYFVRHGQTDWNAQKRLQGQTDIPLNDHGRGQARRNGDVLAQHVSAENFAQLDFIASPLGRARETMEIVLAALGLEAPRYRTDPRLMEMHYGDWEGQTWPRYHQQRLPAMEAWLKDPWTLAPPNGESYADVSSRVGRFLDGIQRDTLIVAHGGIMKVLRGHRLELPSDQIPWLEVPQDQVLVLQGREERWL